MSSIAGRFTTPPSPGEAEMAVGRSNPKASVSRESMKPDAPTPTVAAPTVNSSTRSQPMTKAMS